MQIAGLPDQRASRAVFAILSGLRGGLRAVLKPHPGNLSEQKNLLSRLPRSLRGGLVSVSFIGLMMSNHTTRCGAQLSMSDSRSSNTSNDGALDAAFCISGRGDCQDKDQCHEILSHESRSCFTDKLSLKPKFP